MTQIRFDLTIIILSHNTQFWLKKNLQSLKTNYLRQTKYRVRVVVVDNASTDQTVSLVKKSFRFAELIELPSNVGFAAGNNVVLKKARYDSRFIMLLNSDVELEESANLDPLLEVLENQAKVAVITPRLVTSDGDLDMAAHRGEPTPWASLTYFSGLAKLFPYSQLLAQYHQTYKNTATIHYIDACSGAAMMVKSSAIKKVGLLDESFFMYGEDLDWCKRFRDAGYGILYYPLVTLTHHKYKSGLDSLARQTQRKTTGHFYDTMLQYYDKHYAHRYPAWVRRLLIQFIRFKKVQKGA